MGNVEIFKDHLKRRYGIEVPKSIALQDSENVIRAYSKTLMMMKEKGFMGFVAGKVKPGGIEVKSEFVQMFSAAGLKNSIALDAAHAAEFVNKGACSCDCGDGLVVVVHNGHILGMARAKNKIAHADFIGMGRKRVTNTIKADTSK
jgi:hypothetical protein